MSLKDINKKDRIKLIWIAVIIAVVSVLTTATLISCSGCMIKCSCDCGDSKFCNCVEGCDVSDINVRETTDKDEEKSTVGGKETDKSEEDTILKDESTLDEESTNCDENTTESTKDNEESTTSNGEAATTGKHNSNIISGDTIKKLYVSGTNLVDSSGNIVQLKGISTHGLSWFPQYVNNACFKQLHEDMGVQVVRLAMYSDEYNGYCSGGNKDELKQLVKNGVKYATDNDMYVVIDWHIHADNNPHTHKEEAKKFFAEMAKAYAEYDNVFYEICNEPSGGASWSQIKSYAIEVIKVIRQYDEDGIIIVGTPNWCQYVTEAAKNPITGYDNIMYTLHFYAGTHMESLRNEMVSAIEMGLPIFVTEFGICDASGNGGVNINQANLWMELLDRYGISAVMWNLSNKNESSAAIKSSCNKVSGFGESDLSQSGKWLLDMLNGKVTGNGVNSGTSNSGQNSSGNGNSSENSGTKETTTASYNINADAIAKITNTWGSEGEYFYQLEITVKNNEKRTCTSWTADITFDGNIKVSSGWCGKFTANGNTLHIEPEAYNSVIEAGGQVTGIGIIISSTGEVKVIN